MSQDALRWGILGAARIARQALIPAIRAAGDEVAVLGSRELSRGVSMAADLAIPEVVEGYQPVLERALDCVYIALPNALHWEWTVAALAQGLHVLCEKPLAMTASQASEMAATARRQRLVLAEAVMYRYHPRWARFLSILENGSLGQLRQLSGTFAFTLRQPPDIRWDRALGGGALFDVGTYLVNAARWINQREPDRVSAVGIFRQGVDETVNLVLNFPDSGQSGPSMAALSCGFASAESQWLRVDGTRGWATLERPFTAWHSDSLPIICDMGSGRVEEIPCPAADPYEAMVRAFGRAVRDGGSTATGADDSAANLADLDACFRSLNTGQVESVLSLAG